MARPARLARKGHRDVIQILDNWPAADTLGYARHAIDLLT